MAAEAEPMTVQLEKRIKAGLKSVDFLEIKDMSDGCGSKLSMILASSDFAGMGLLDRQRKVNEIIAEEMKSIHALTMKTWTPEQYAKKKAQGKV